MKLSELKVKEFKQMSIKLLPLLKKITGDEDLKKAMFKPVPIELGMTELEIKKIKSEYKINKVYEVLEIFLEKHEETFYSILAIINNITPEEVENWTLSEIVNSLMDIGEDEGFNRLFTLAVK